MDHVEWMVYLYTLFVLLRKHRSSNFQNSVHVVAFPGPDLVVLWFDLARL